MTEDQLLEIRVNPTDTKKEDQRNGMNSASTDLGHVWRSVAREVGERNPSRKLFTDSAQDEYYRTTIVLARCKMVEGEYVSHKSFVMYHHIYKSFISLNEVHNALKSS